MRSSTSPTSRRRREAIRSRPRSAT
jgi:hypothetical protein